MVLYFSLVEQKVWTLKLRNFEGSLIDLLFVKFWLMTLCLKKVGSRMALHQNWALFALAMALDLNGGKKIFGGKRLLEALYVNQIHPSISVQGSVKTAGCKFTY